MKSVLTLLASLALLVHARAEGLTNILSFAEETKIKGPFTEIGGELYFACEKGGASNFGYIGKFNPTAGTLAPLHQFTQETKIKGGFTLVSNAFLWFVCEKGGTANFGYLGSFNVADGTVDVLHEFATETKPKTAPAALDGNGWCFLAEKAGASGVGALLRYVPGSGVSVAASFTTVLGVKAESLTVFGGQIYYAAREGGDTTQLAGKGAGAIGTIDLATGTVTKLADLNAASHGAKIKSLVPFQGKLYYAAEEGGNLALNSAKGFGALGWFDPADNSFNQFFVSDDVITGTKPRGLLPVGDRLYFNCGEGGPNTYGTFGGVTNGTNAVILGVNDVTIGAKTDVGITRYGNFIYFVTELGCANFLGGISAYELPSLPTTTAPSLTFTATGNTLEITWPAAASDFVLERCDQPSSGNWSVIADPGTTTASIPLNGTAGFFRLRKPAD